MINIESLCATCLKKDGCQTYKEVKVVPEIYLIDECEKYIKDVNAVLDKIKKEIEQMQTYDQFTGESYSAHEFKSDVLDIIDRYSGGDK